MHTWPQSLAIAVIALLTLTLATHADTVTLSNGDTLTGTVVARTKKTVTLQHPVLGKVQIPAAKIKSVHIVRKKTQAAAGATQGTAQKSSTASSAAGEAKAAASQPKLAAPEGGLFDHPFFKGWHSELSLGFAGSQGNTKTRSLNSEFKTRKQTKKIRWLFDAKYFYNSDHSQTTENQFDGQLTHDWLLPKSPWFYFARGRYEYDQFQDWKSRISAYGGGGYTFVSHPDLQVLGRLGFGATKNLGGDHSLTPEALIGASAIHWKITKSQTLSLSETLYPALEHLGRFRNIFDASWKVKIDEADGLSLKLGLQDQYDSHVTGTDKRNNLKYYGAVVLDF